METLHLFGTERAEAAWLEPLLDGEIRSGVRDDRARRGQQRRHATSQTPIVRDGDDYVINGRKWWTCGAADPRCKILIVMGKTDPAAPPHRQQSMVLVPLDTPGVDGRAATCRSSATRTSTATPRSSSRDVRVPVTNLLGEEGGGFAIAQARLGPGRIHHCMRALGAAERALALMVARAKERVAFGKPLAEQGVVQQQIAESRIEIEQARLLCHQAADVIDTDGNKAARDLVAAIKVAVPAVAARRDRPGHPGARRGRRHRRHPAGGRCTAGTARCASSTAPTRCTCARSPGPSSAARRCYRRTSHRRGGSTGITAARGWWRWPGRRPRTWSAGRSGFRCRACGAPAWS